MPAFTYLVGAFLLAVSVVTLWRQSRARQSKLPLPPGPPQLPIIGNLLDMPSKFQWITFIKWGAQFNTDIIYLNVAGTPLIVLNSFTAATDLLEKRSRIYSSRPTLSMLTDEKLMGWSGDFAFMEYGDDWNAHRKLFVKYAKTLTRRHEWNKKSCHQVFLNNLLDSPDQFEQHLRYLFGSITLSVAYGIDILPKDDPYVETAKNMLELIKSGISPGAFVVDFIPWLKYIPEWFPGATFKRLANKNRGIHKKGINAPFVHAKTNLAKGIVQDSFVTHYLQEAQATGDGSSTALYQEQLIEETAGTFYEGGADTGLTAMLTFILAMVLYPHQQAKAQEELDRVVGNDRLPEHADAADLPYITAVIKECLRWQSVVPFVPHYIHTEDEYRGYHIPKGSVVIGNAWAILHDPEMYPDPDTFNPDRWLLMDTNGHYVLNPDIRDVTVGFGFGRRVCPGMDFALSIMFTAVASILHSFNINKAIDENGDTITPKLEYTSSIFNQPAPFKCSITPRSEKHVSLIQALK